MPIGRPVWNTQVYVLDRYLRPVPPGVQGELYLAGVQLARGYAGRRASPPNGSSPRRSVLSLLGHGCTGPVTSRAGTPTGYLEFLGRADDQVKIRGQRVELGEIESALLRSPDVTEAAVLLRDGDRLVGYVVGTPPSRESLREVLPEHMVPSAFVVLDALPLSANGKLDRKALPAPEIQVGTAAPRDAREALLCQVFAEVLGVPSVGVDDDFFALGGHSLLATKLASRIRSVFGVEVPIRSLFEHTTVGALYDALPSETSERAAIVRRERPDRVPLSASQQRLWVLHELHGPNPGYNIAAALRLSGRLDQAALELALGDVVWRHEALRTVLAADDEGAHQVVLSSVKPVLEVAEVSEAQLDAEIVAAARYAFDITSELPVRATLFATGPDSHVLLLVLHHVAGDGWSLPVLAGELTRAYAAYCAGGAPEWQPLPVQYADYALWQRDLLGSADDPASLVARQLAFWTDALRGVPAELALPVDRTRPAVPSYRGGRVEFTMPAAVRDRVTALAQAEDVTVFMVLQAALAVLLSRVDGGTDIPIGTPVAGRTDEAVENLIGFFVNSLVLRNDLTGDPSFRELLARVREADLAAFAHQDVPFERLVDALAPERSMSRHPLFQVMLNVDGADRRTAMEAVRRLPGLDVSRHELDLGTAKFDLTFNVRADDLDGELVYSTDLFEHATAQSIVELFAALLDRLVAVPDEAVSAFAGFEVLPQTSLVDVPELALPDLFTLKAPDAVAVECGEVRLTYAELDARANRLAHWLNAQGIGAEQLVALEFGRTADAFVAMLGVLKAGAAYLPLDPEYPRERIEFMVADARPALVLRELPDLSGMPGTALDVRIQPDQPAYVIYTSGTTGRPKGVVVTHTGFGSLLTLAAEHGVAAGGRVLQFASFSFDVSVLEMWTAWSTGATLVVLPDRTDVADFVARQRITYAKLPVSVVAAFGGDVELPVSTLVVGGEACPQELARRWSAGRTMINAYGPTETTVNVVTSAPLTGDGIPPIGRPIANAGVHVLDRFLRPVPPGVAGELYVSGPGPGARVPRQARPHRATVRRFPARSDVPHGRPGALDRDRRAAVRRPRGRPGEAARVPDRAGRDRVGAARAGRAGRGGRARRQARRLRRRRSAEPGEAREDVARLPDPGRVRGAGRAAADRQREAGPGRAARTGVHRLRFPRGRRRHRGVALRAVRRGAAGRPGRRRRRVLRARRRQHHGDPAGEPRPSRGSAVHRPGRVRAADRRRAGTGDPGRAGSRSRRSPEPGTCRCCRSCTGSPNAVGRSVTSASRTWCRCRRMPRKTSCARRCRRCSTTTTRYGCGWTSPTAGRRTSTRPAPGSTCAECPVWTYGTRQSRPDDGSTPSPA